jgi:hypothetical protein
MFESATHVAFIVPMTEGLYMEFISIIKTIHLCKLHEPVSNTV